MSKLESNDPVRDPRAAAPVIAMDLTRPDSVIHADLRDRWPRDPGMWWELETDEKSGWVYNASGRILAKLVQS
jgi:hypothetical protein